MGSEVSDSARLTAGLTSVWNEERAQRLIGLLADSGCAGAYTEYFGEGDEQEFLLTYVVKSHVDDMDDALVTLWIVDREWQLDCTSPDGSALSSAAIGDAPGAATVTDDLLVTEFLKLVSSWRWSLGPFDE